MIRLFKQKTWPTGGAEVSAVVHQVTKCLVEVRGKHEEEVVKKVL